MATYFNLYAGYALNKRSSRISTIQINTQNQAAVISQHRRYSEIPINKMNLRGETTKNIDSCFIM